MNGQVVFGWPQRSEAQGPNQLLGQRAGPFFLCALAICCTRAPARHLVPVCIYRHPRVRVRKLRGNHSRNITNVSQMILILQTPYWDGVVFWFRRCKVTTPRRDRRICGTSISSVTIQPSDCMGIPIRPLGRAICRWMPFERFMRIRTAVTIRWSWRKSALERGGVF